MSRATALAKHWEGFLTPDGKRIAIAHLRERVQLDGEGIVCRVPALGNRIIDPSSREWLAFHQAECERIVGHALGDGVMTQTWPGETRTELRDVPCSEIFQTNSDGRPFSYLR